MRPHDEDTRVSELISKPAPPKDASLVQIYGPKLGQRKVITASETTLGRDQRNDIVIDNDTVSRFHARILVKANNIHVEDLKSTNGSRVNEQEITSCILKNGDHLKIGSVVFKFITGGNTEALYHEEIYRMAIFDGLTGIPNRRYFEEFLERELARAIRYKRPLALALIDTDHFKQVNDTHSHLAGDYVLRHLAHIARQTTRREELFARYGGEEFVLVMPEKPAQQAAIYAEKLRLLIQSASFEFNGNSISITVSIGLANLRDNIRTVPNFVQAADDQLYRAKTEGRNRVCITS